MKIKFSSLIVLFLAALVLGSQVQAVDYQTEYDNFLNDKIPMYNQLYAKAQDDYNTALQTNNIAGLIKIKQDLNSIYGEIEEDKKDCNTYASDVFVQNQDLSKKFRELRKSFTYLENAATSLQNEISDVIDYNQLNIAYDDLNGQLGTWAKAVDDELQIADGMVVQKTGLENVVPEIKKLQDLKSQIIEIEKKAKKYSATASEIQANDLLSKFNGLIADADDLNEQLTEDGINYLGPYSNNLATADLKKFDDNYNTYNAQVLDLGAKLKTAQCGNDAAGAVAQKSALKTVKDKAQTDIDLANSRISLFNANGFGDMQTLYNNKIVRLNGLIKSIDEMSNKVYTADECKTTIPPIDNGTNKVPVLNSIGSKTVTVGSTLSFTISATDADNDVLTYSIENKPATASFDANTKTFSWTPVSTETGTYTVTFKAVDGKGGETKEVVSITVSTSTPLTKLQEAQKQFNSYQEDYDNYKNDYSDYKKKYDKAVSNNDVSNTKKYKNELNGLDDELNDLSDNLDDLKDDADALTDGDAVYDDAKDLQKDVEALRTKIKNVLNGATSTTESTTTQVSAASNVNPIVVNKQPVEVQKLGTMPGPGVVATEEVQDVNSTNDFRAKALLIGGIVVLIAVIIFLMAVVLF